MQGSMTTLSSTVVFFAVVALRDQGSPGSVVSAVLPPAGPGLPCGGSVSVPCRDRAAILAESVVCPPCSLVFIVRMFYPEEFLP